MDKLLRAKRNILLFVGPTFALFVNDPDIMHFSYKRYLENYLRKTFELDATPIRMLIRKRGSKD